MLLIRDITKNLLASLVAISTLFQSKMKTNVRTSFSVLFWEKSYVYLFIFSPPVISKFIGRNNQI